jgi:FAD/FMN-containing dehydrogenase
VTADGLVQRASRGENADLFWGVRGAGANLGVVTSFTFGLHDVGPTVVGGLVAWPFARAEEILATYKKLTEEAPRELAVWLLLLHAPPAPFVPPEWHGRKICAMAICYSGDLARTDEALAPIRALGDPILDLVHEQPYVEVQSYLDATEPRGICHYWRTEYLSELGDGLLETMRELAASCELPETELGVLHVGGALNERPEDDGAVGNRDARYAIGAKAMWSPDAGDRDRIVDWVRGAHERIKPFSTGRTYVNFQAHDEDDARVREGYGTNYERLVELKRRYDPDNVFRSNRNVAP